MSATNQGIALDQLFGHILLVEDNPTNQKVASMFLKKLGLTWVIANNGKEAVELISSGSTFNLVLMDLFMPVMNGIDATKAIRCWEHINQMPPIPIIAQSADVYSETITEAMESGMNGFINKPIDLHELHSALAKSLAPANATL